MDGSFVNGDDCNHGGGGFNDGTGAGYWLWNLRTGQKTKKATTPTGANHSSSKNYFDTFENFGGTGAGPGASGLRYATYSRYGGPRGIMGIRLGPNDMNQIRYICNHRSARGSGSDECHPGYDPWMRSCVFNSDWNENGQNGEQVNTYAVIIPDAWQSPNNDGS
jgi:hypothetical protein